MLINSTFYPGITFTKTSQKFGQWADAKLNTVYGLGFPNDKELNNVSKMGPSKICGRQPLKDLSRLYPSKFFKGYFPQILLGLILNTLS